jgi:hypothetical protein
MISAAGIEKTGIYGKSSKHPENLALDFMAVNLLYILVESGQGMR